MTADERLIDLDAANERLAGMNLNADGAIRIPPAEPTRKRAEAVKGKCQRCGDAYSRHKLGLTGDVRYCRRGTAGSTWSAPATPVAASTKQEGGAGITHEQATKLRKLIEAKEEANVNWQNAADAIKLASDEQARTQIELFEFINSLRAKDAR